MKIIKRDGNLQSFDRTKITEAVNKSIRAVKGIGDDNLSNDITGMVVKGIGENQKIVNIEEIQNLVEKSLMELSEYDIAKA